MKNNNMSVDGIWPTLYKKQIVIRAQRFYEHIDITLRATNTIY